MQIVHNTQLVQIMHIPIIKIDMQDFAAIDFETANNERSSVCSVGVVIVRGGEIVD